MTKQEEMPTPKAFISYSWSSPEHEKWVLDLANELENEAGVHEEISHFFKSALQLDQIDWEVIRSWSWKYRIDDMDRKRRKQAEFLV